MFCSSTVPRSATFSAKALSAGLPAGLERFPVGGLLNRSNWNISVRIRRTASVIVEDCTCPAGDGSGELAVVPVEAPALLIEPGIGGVDGRGVGCAVGADESVEAPAVIE